MWFYGNWRNYPDKYDELYSVLKWRDIQYHNRVGHSDFKEIYNDAVACPLLGKEEYFTRGFMTARIQECLYFGSIPIGFEEHYMIEKYLPKNLIVSENNNLENVISNIENMTINYRNDFRHSLWKNLEFMDCSIFVNNIIENV